MIFRRKLLNISASENGGEIPKINYSRKYFTIESLADSNTIKIAKSNSPSNISLSYSIDNGSTWTNLTINSGRDLVTINNGDKILFKGVNNRLATAWNAYYRFNPSKNFKVYGNAMSLLFGDSFIVNSEFTSGTTNNFAGLFFGTTTLIDASNLILPALTCTANCYNGMFRDCTNLTVAPQLPALYAADQCYSSMFEQCINLEVAPEINFTVLNTSCCKRMFLMNRNYKVTTPKMTKSPILRCAKGVNNCYEEMFKGNGNLVEITCLLTNDASNTTKDWVLNTGNNGIFYKSSLKTNWNTGQNGIPSGWTIEDYTE